MTSCSGVYPRLLQISFNSATMLVGKYKVAGMATICVSISFWATRESDASGSISMSQSDRTVSLSWFWGVKSNFEVLDAGRSADQSGRFQSASLSKLFLDEALSGQF